jgi:hypothetical protein
VARDCAEPGAALGPAVIHLRRIALVRWAAMVVLVAALYWGAVFLAMHVLQPEFSPIKAPGSAYVLGAYGAWMTTTYFALCTALVATALGLRESVPATGMSRTAIAAFLIAAGGTVLAGLNPMDFPGPPHSTSGRLHAVGGALTFPPWVVGAFLFSLEMRRDDRWRRYSATLLMLSAGSIALAVVLIGSMLVLGFAGYAQRLVLALLFAWMIVVALHLLRSPS